MPRNPDTLHLPPEPVRFLLRGFALGTVSERKTDKSTHLYNLLVKITTSKHLVQKLYNLISAIIFYTKL